MSANKPNDKQADGFITSGDQYAVNQPAFNHADDGDADEIEREEAEDRSDPIGHEPLPREKGQNNQASPSADDPHKAKGLGYGANGETEMHDAPDSSD
ncbi:hypothetical protein GRI39_09515 [Altererythrobacter indicus]|uniref:Uncharacterized protein n=2 Tax=Altericroceibacterium indicum TaxID=374177 RepID=A0A845A7C2_9SPHN|nr:hypothetical protein [Altericroceibacterium indicum]